MDPRLRLERALGVPDAIVSASNRKLVAGRLLRRDIELSFDRPSVRASSDDDRMEQMLDTLGTIAMEEIVSLYRRGELDLEIVGDATDRGRVPRLAAAAAEGARELLEGEVDFSWNDTDDLTALIRSAVTALRRWADAHPVEPASPQPS